MTWVVVVIVGNWPNRVIGPMAKESAQALARGLSGTSSGGENQSGMAVQLDAP